MDTSEHEAPPRYIIISSPWAAKNSNGLPGVGRAFRAVGVFATAIEIAARFNLRSAGLRIVGLFRVPSLSFTHLRLISFVPRCTHRLAHHIQQVR